MTSRPVAFVLAENKGSGLYPLTLDRAPAAISFASRYRLIDVVLSNLVNSGIHSIFVLTQYKAQSLIEHVRRAWGFRGHLSEQVTVVPAQMRMGQAWYRGSADAVFQNIHLLEETRADPVLVVGSQQVCRMNVQQLMEFHRRKKASATIACIPMPVEKAAPFTIAGTDEEGRIVALVSGTEARRFTIPGDASSCFVCMGSYAFAPGPLIKELRDDAERESRHDLVGDILPTMVRSSRVFAYDFTENRIPGVLDVVESVYWRDVTDIETYYKAQLDLTTVVPSFNLYNREWPLKGALYSDEPAKLVFDDETRRGLALQSMLGAGCIVAGGFVRNSVLGRNVFVDAGAEVKDSVLGHHVYVGRGARIQRAIVDSFIRVAEGDHIGHDLARDSLRFTVTDEGTTVVQGGHPSVLARMPSAAVP